MVLRSVVLLVMAPWSAVAQSCPPVNLLVPRTVNLKPSATSHLDVVRQTDGSYTGFEVTDAPPHRTLAVTPRFEQQFAACLPHSLLASPAPPPAVNSPGAEPQLQVSTSLSDGNLFAAGISSDSLTIYFDVFDAQHNLLSETPFTSVVSPPGYVGSANERFLSLALTDLNRDGNLDLIAVLETPLSESGAYGGVWTFLGNGDGTFRTGNRQVLASRSQGLGAPAGTLGVGDFNADGKPDIVVTGPYGTPVLLALGNGDGTFNPQTLPVPLSDSAPVAIADLNGDGKADIVAGNSSTVAVLLGNGDGTFRAATSWPVTSAASLAVADLNGDGFPDIATAGGTILFGDGHGSFSTRTDYAVTAAGTVMIGDVDGDGIADVLFGTGNANYLSGNSLDPTVTVLFGAGGGSFIGAPIAGAGLVTNISQPFATADFTGDGIPDLALAVAGANALRLTMLAGQGNGQFPRGTLQSFPEPAGTLALFSVAADFNHDGKPDLAVLVQGSDTEVQVYAGKGDGTFAAPTVLTVPLTPPPTILSLAAPDLNGDGIPDLVITTAGVILVWLGKGDGTFGSPVSTLSVSSPAVAFGDFNGDGKLDLAFVNEASTSLNVMPGKGDGTFAGTVTTALPAAALGAAAGIGFPNTIAAADFDGDGRQDIALIFGPNVMQGLAGGQFQIALLSGQGNGSFSATHLTPGLITGFVPADLNRDGTPDLLGYSNAGFAPGGLSARLGKGDGTFQPDLLLQPGQGEFVVADFDRNGTPDVAALTPAGIAIFLNLTQPPAALSVVSGATFASGPLAADSFASAFGERLGPGVTVSVQDSAGVSRSAAVLFASATQINFLIPAETAPGAATVTVTGATSGAPLSAGIQIAPVAPALFSLSSGLAAADVVRVAPDGTQTISPVSAPIDLTQPGQVYLVLYGTGFDQATSASTTVAVQGVSVPVTWSGPQGTYPGLDQINVQLPPALAGSGVSTVIATVAGKTAGAVYIPLR